MLFSTPGVAVFPAPRPSWSETKPDTKSPVISPVLESGAPPPNSDRATLLDTGTKPLDSP